MRWPRLRRRPAPVRLVITIRYPLGVTAAQVLREVETAASRQSRG